MLPNDLAREAGDGVLIAALMLLHVISALDTLEKLLPAEESGEYAVKKREWEAFKKACWAECRAREGKGGWDFEIVLALRFSFISLSWSIF
jgi:hypothetical protein